MAGPWEDYQPKEAASAGPWSDYAPAKPVAEKSSWLDDVKGGLASAPISAYLGIKQAFGGLDSIEQNILEQNKQAAKKAPASAFAGNVAMMVPSMFIPGANTVAGAGVIGAVNGLVQPVEGEQTLGNIAQGKAVNTGIGGALGAGGQAVANKVGGWVMDRLSSETQDAARRQSLNSMKDATLAEGRSAGYVVPPSEINPTFLSNRLESLGGKAAIKQEAALRNQSTTNDLARKAMGIADDQPISVSALEAIRKNSGKAYEDVSSLSGIAKQDLEALKLSRNEAQGWFNAYNRSASPLDLAKAKAARDMSDQLEESLRNEAVSAGRNDLLPSLVEARKQIAKSYTVQRALNPATGDVSAPILGRMYGKGKPLSDGLDTIGAFNQAFPKFTGVGVSTPAAGVSKAEMLSGGLLGIAGSAATGSPLGLLAAGLPLLSHPARSMALSGALQKAPEYAAGALSKLGGRVMTPELAGVYLRSIGVAATPELTSAMLSAQ